MRKQIITIIFLNFISISSCSVSSIYLKSLWEGSQFSPNEAAAADGNVNRSSPVENPKTTPRPSATRSSAPGKATMGRQQLLLHLSHPMNKQQNSDFLPTIVMAKLIPIKIQDLNEKNEVLETTLRLQLSWRDYRLSWDPLVYHNTTEVIIPGNVIWAPDIAILNSVSDIYHVVRDTRFEMKVESDGRVWWHPTGIVKTYCKLHLRYFPFDRQNCSIVLESPTLDIRFMNLTLRSQTDPVDTVMYISGETWDLVSVTGANYLNKVTSKTTFARVEFYIYLERAKIYHLLNVILPAIFLSFVQVMFFLLPASHPQRVGSSTTTLLSVVVFQSVAASQLPKTSTDVPLLAVYIFIVTFISGLSVCTSIFVAKMAVYDGQRELPAWLKSIPHYTEIFRTKSKPMNDSKEIISSSQSSTSTTIPARTNARRPMFETWSDFSDVCDMCLFHMAVVIAISAPILLFIIIPSLVEDK